MELRRGAGYWVWIGGPVAPGAAATTLGPLILIKRRYADDAELLRHEVEHVHQWRRYGVVGFLRRYLRDYGRWRLAGYSHWAAYRRIPFEIQAEWAARQEFRLGSKLPRRVG